MLTVMACLFGTTATIVCLRAWRKLTGTTLAAPCKWAVTSLGLVTCAVAAGRFAGDPAGATWMAHVRYLAGVTTLAPFVALLGAKRPQDRAWQLIVAAIVGLFAFQDLRIWTLDPSLIPTPHAAWKWLTTGLIVVQLLNHVATRHAAAACLAFAGQVCLLKDNLVVTIGDFARLTDCGLLLVSLAVFVAALGERRGYETRDEAQFAWLEFRDRYGALWALRVAERVNAVAAQHDSHLRLSWSGFPVEQSNAEQNVGRQPIPDAGPVRKTLRAVLSRFVRAA